VKAYGHICAREVLLFNEAYYGLYDVCMRMEREAGGGRVRPPRRRLVGSSGQSLSACSSNCRRASLLRNSKATGTAKNSDLKGWPAELKPG